MIKKLIQKLKLKKAEKIISTPRYAIKDLYVGNIVFKEKEKYEPNDIKTSFYKEVKKSVIVVNIDYIRYQHIKSQQTLKELYWADTNDYALTDMAHFKNKFMMYLRKNHLQPETKLSIKQVVQLEDALQTGLYNDLENSELFD